MYGVVCCVCECLYICVLVVCVHVIEHAFGTLVVYVPSSV